MMKSDVGFKGPLNCISLHSSISELLNVIQMHVCHNMAKRVTVCMNPCMSACKLVSSRYAQPLPLSMLHNLQVLSNLLRLAAAKS